MLHKSCPAVSAARSWSRLQAADPPKLPRFYHPQLAPKSQKFMFILTHKRLSDLIFSNVQLIFSNYLQKYHMQIGFLSIFLASFFCDGQTSLLGGRDVQHPLVLKDLRGHPARPADQRRILWARELVGRQGQTATGGAAPGVQPQYFWEVFMGKCLGEKQL